MKEFTERWHLLLLLKDTSKDGIYFCFWKMLWRGCGNPMPSASVCIEKWHVFWISKDVIKDSILFISKDALQIIVYVKWYEIDETWMIPWKIELIWKYFEIWKIDFECFEEFGWKLIWIGLNWNELICIEMIWIGLDENDFYAIICRKLDSLPTYKK